MTETLMMHWIACVPVGSVVSDTFDPTDRRQPGSSVHGIFQARTLEQIAISYSRGSSWPSDQTCISWIGRQILYHWATRDAVLDEIVQVQSEVLVWRPTMYSRHRQNKTAIFWFGEGTYQLPEAHQLPGTPATGVGVSTSGHYIKPYD